MAAVTAISPVTTATGSGTANLASLVNKFALQVLSAMPIGGGGLVLEVSASWDGGQTFVPVKELARRGSIWVFDTPADHVKVSFTGNQAGNQVAVYALALSD